jgi:hypothetical protein
MTDAEENRQSVTPTNSPILPTGTAAAVPKATTLGTRLDLASPQYAEKARPVAPLAGVYTPSEPNPPMPEDPNQALMCSFQKMIEATMALVYKRLDDIKHPSITNAYQPPPGASKWIDYEDEEADPRHIASELEYADLDPQNAAANREADHCSNIEHVYHILEAGQCEQLELAEQAHLDHKADVKY